jgi:hypothetical protein
MSSALRDFSFESKSSTLILGREKRKKGLAAIVMRLGYSPNLSNFEASYKLENSLH